MKAWFVTGTDTGVGKSLVAAALLHRLRGRYDRVVGMKPVAAGAQHGADGRWRNEDVASLQAASSIQAPAELVNPCLLREPASPHIAARLEGVRIDVGRIVAAFEALGRLADAVIVEGAGGFRVPLNETEDGADLAAALRLPVILVVGIRLGCLNHALLTAQSIATRGLPLAGWIANRMDPGMPHQAANLDLLGHRLAAPLLADIPFQRKPDPVRSAAHFHLPESFFP